MTQAVDLQRRDLAKITKNGSLLSNFGSQVTVQLCGGEGLGLGHVAFLQESWG
jgi:hypothetical protein